jgi:hypothetical protein
MYLFNGTNIAAMSFSIENAQTATIDETGHGTALASVVARDAPGALILSLQTDPRLCVDPSCVIGPSLAAAMEWAASQPWIDIIVTSTNMPGNPPDSEAVHEEAGRFVAATRLAHDNGKLIVSSAGNYLGPTYTSYFAGPPWVIAAGGFDAPHAGETLVASKGVDVVANFTERVAVHNSQDGYATMSGTSLSSPSVAATLAKAMSISRTRASQCAEETLVRERLRAAMNASAAQFTATAWAPPGPSVLDDPAAVSAPILVGESQMGWGYVNANLSPRIAEIALCETQAADSSAANLQATRQGVREAYWAER